MFPIPEPISSATKANLEAQLAAFTALSTKMVESFEQVIDLNINAGKALLEDQAITTRQLLAAKDPQELVSLAAAQAQPAAARMIAYGRHLANITGSVQADFVRTAEESMAEAGRKMGAYADDAGRNAPPGADGLMAMFRTAFGNASAGYEQFNRATRQAVDAMEANMTASVNQFTDAAGKTASRAKK